MPLTLHIMFCALFLLSLAKCSPFVSVAVPMDVGPYLQPNHVLDRDYFSDTSCYRHCEEGAPPRTCYYKWTLSRYKTMGPSCRNCPTNVTDCFQNRCITADGYERGILTVNYQIPGPSIQVCLGDRIIVDVENGMEGQSATIHWHGAYQRGSPYMDGVPMVTQCPITEMTTFRYDFRVTNFGTLYWHSHDGFQKQDGIQGALVVRTPDSLDPNSHLYDYDLASHVIFISDWMQSSAGEHIPGLTTHDRFQEPNSILLNGRGRIMTNVLSTEAPYSVFRVTHGKKYRFRIVGGMCTSCAYKFSVQEHDLLVIAVDGCPIEPVLVNSIDMYAGERYDFVLHASNEIKSYWIHMKTIGNCEDIQLYTLGILRYIGDKDKSTMSQDPGHTGYPSGKVMNPYNGACRDKDKGVCINQLVSLHPVPQRITACEPDFSFKLIFGFHSFSTDDLSQPGGEERYFAPANNRLVISVVNNISYVMPQSPLVSQRHDIRQSVFCPTGYDGTPRCPLGSVGFCECVHMIRIPLGALAQFILIDRGSGGINHPFHMHGFSFNVIAMGNFENGQDEDDITEDLRRGTLKLSTSPAFKDTLAVPALGYAVIRILANNPGYWFFHCHVLYHAGTGMALVLQVGEDSEIPHPPLGFPRCGDFIPPVYKEVKQQLMFSACNKS